MKPTPLCRQTVVAPGGSSVRPSPPGVKRGRRIRAAQRSSESRLQGPLDRGRGAGFYSYPTPGFPFALCSLCTGVSLFGAAGVSPSPESPLESGQEPATAAPDRASVPAGMRAPDTWKASGERMRSGRKQLYTGTLTNKSAVFAAFHLSFEQ